VERATVMKKKRRAPRPSFVVTAGLPGCGGQVAGTSGPDGYGSNPPANVVDSGVADVDAGAGACPTTEPSVGAPCAFPDTYCDYSTCTSIGGRGNAYQCLHGFWATSMPPSCNPPTICPTEEPMPGTPCTASGFGACSYTDRCAEQPLGTGKDTLRCAGTWQLVGDYMLTCPTSPPANGSPCRCGVHTSYSTVCTYCGPVYGSSGEGASCDAKTGTWVVTPVTCNPPAPPPDAGFEVGLGDAATD